MILTCEFIRIPIPLSDNTYQIQTTLLWLMEGAGMAFLYKAFRQRMYRGKYRGKVFRVRYHCIAFIVGVTVIIWSTKGRLLV
jgi:hypothetical protein